MAKGKRSRREDSDNDQGSPEHAYERMLQRARHLLDEAEESTRPRVRHAVERARQRAVELGELSRERSERIAEYLRRDLEEAGSYLATTGRGLRDWLQFDLEYLERSFLDYLISAADYTRVELAELERQGRGTEYRCGEISAPGTFHCRSCGQTMTLRKTGRLPPCPKCHGKTFLRPQP